MHTLSRTHLLSVLLACSLILCFLPSFVAAQQQDQPTATSANSTTTTEPTPSPTRFVPDRPKRGCDTDCAAIVSVVCVAAVLSAIGYYVYVRYKQKKEISPEISVASLFSKKLPADVGYMSPSVIASETGRPKAWFNHLKSKPEIGAVSKAVIYAGVTDDLGGRWALRMNNNFSKKKNSAADGRADVGGLAVLRGNRQQYNPEERSPIKLEFEDQVGGTTAIFHSAPLSDEIPDSSGKRKSGRNSGYHAMEVSKGNQGTRGDFEIRDGMIDLASSRLQFRLVYTNGDSILCYGYLIIPVLPGKEQKEAEKEMRKIRVSDSNDSSQRFGERKRNSSPTRGGLQRKDSTFSNDGNASVTSVMSNGPSNISNMQSLRRSFSKKCSQSGSTQSSSAMNTGNFSEYLRGLGSTGTFGGPNGQNTASGIFGGGNLALGATISNFDTINSNASSAAALAGNQSDAIELEMAGHWVNKSDLSDRGEFKLSSNLRGFQMDVSRGGTAHLKSAFSEAERDALKRNIREQRAKQREQRDTNAALGDDFTAIGVADTGGGGCEMGSVNPPPMDGSACTEVFAQSQNPTATAVPSLEAPRDTPLGIQAVPESVSTSTSLPTPQQLIIGDNSLGSPSTSQKEEKFAGSASAGTPTGGSQLGTKLRRKKKATTPNNNNSVDVSSITASSIGGSQVLGANASGDVPDQSLSPATHHQRQHSASAGSTHSQNTEAAPAERSMMPPVAPTLVVRAAAPPADPAHSLASNHGTLSPGFDGGSGSLVEQRPAPTIETVLVESSTSPGSSAGSTMNTQGITQVPPLHGGSIANNTSTLSQSSMLNRSSSERVRYKPGDGAMEELRQSLRSSMTVSPSLSQSHRHSSGTRSSQGSFEVGSRAGSGLTAAMQGSTRSGDQFLSAPPAGGGISSSRRSTQPPPVSDDDGNDDALQEDHEAAALVAEGVEIHISEGDEDDD